MSANVPLLELKHLEVGIGDRCFCRDLNLVLKPGECLAILGRNGAGKSTLLSVLAGLRAQNSGEVRIAGKTYAEQGSRQAALVRGWLPQARQDAFAATVMETAMAGRHPHLDRWDWESEKDVSIVRASLTAVGMAPMEHRNILTLSGGERQRVAIAALLAQQSQLLLLDEPIAHLDLKHQVAMLKLFARESRERNAAVVMVLHEPALARRFCDRALLVHGDGDVEEGDIASMLTAEKLSALFQYPLATTEYGGYVGFIPQ